MAEHADVPGLPILLALVYKYFGLNYQAMKTLTCGFLILSLLPIYALARRSLSAGSALAIVIFLGLGPMYLSLKDMILSDLPYLFFSFTALYLAQRIYDRDLNKSSPYVFGIGMGLLLAFTYMTRSIGISVLGGLCIFDLLKHRRPTRFLIAVICTAGAAAVASNVFVHNDSNYAVQFTLHPSIYAKSCYEYLTRFSYLWINGYSNVVRFVMWGIASGIAILGLLRRFKNGLSILEYYGVLYFGVICVYHVSNPRYLIPLLPIYLIYLFEGLNVLARFLPPGRVAILRVGIVACMFLSIAGNISVMETGPIEEGVLRPTFTDLCQYVRANTQPQALLVFWNPRVLALYTERRAAGSPALSPSQMWSFFTRLKADYMVIYSRDDDDRIWLANVVAEYPQRFNLAYENTEFKVYRILQN